MGAGRRLRASRRPPWPGRPGIYSARYAGEDATDAENLAKLLDALAGRATAVSATSPSWWRSPPTAASCTPAASCAARWPTEPRGDGGFGYDPAFVADGETRTVAEMCGGREGRDLAPRAGRSCAALPLPEQAVGWLTPRPGRPAPAAPAGGAGSISTS